MSGRLERGLTALLLRGVPAHVRDSVDGDLRETGGGPRDALSVALAFQAEPYRAPPDRRAALGLMLAATGLLWLVPQAATLLLADAAVFDGPLARSALRAWQMPGVVAAAGAGLLLGRASVLPPHADPARAHGVLLLIPVALVLAPGSGSGLLAAAVLVAAAALGHAHRLSSLTAATTPRSP